MSIVSSLHTPVCIWCPPHSKPLDTACFEGGGWEEMIHSSVKAQDTNPGWPADQMVDIAHRSRCRCRAILIREHGERVIISPVVTLCDSKHKPASTLKMCTWHHLIQMSYQIRNCRGGSMIWGPDRPVRAVIILLQEEIWIFASGVFVSAGVLWVNVSHQNFAEADIYSSKLLWLLWTGNFKTQHGGRWLSAAVCGAEIDVQ